MNKGKVGVLGYVNVDQCQTGDPYSGSPCGDFDMGFTYNGSSYTYQGCSHTSGCNGPTTDNQVILTGNSVGTDNIYAWVQDNANYACLALAYGTAVVIDPPCPPYTNLAESQFVSLYDFSSSYRTGMGAATRIHVGDSTDSTDYDNALIDETITAVPNSNSCPASAFVDPCGNGSSQFTVGDDAVGSFYPAAFATHNSFWDLHGYDNPYDLLGYAGIDSCSATCTQTYRCHSTGDVVGTYTLYYDFSKSIVNGNPSTIVHVVKN